MAKLWQISKDSPLMDTTISINGESFTFNLHKELKINTENIDPCITNHSQVHAFLGRVHALLSSKMEMAESRKKKIWAQEYVRLRKTKDKLTGRPCSDDYCKAKVEIYSKYRKAISNYIKVREQYQTIGNALQSFENRKSLLQTISSNKRNNA